MMLIHNAKLITWEQPNRILEDHAVLVEDGLITGIGPSADLAAQYRENRGDPGSVIDARGQYLLPGNICAHTHFYGAFARGMAIPEPAPESFPEILQKLWWPLDMALDEEAVRYSALVCLIDAIRHGTTTLIDHHASPGCIDGSLDNIADAVDQAGARAVLCYEVTDRNGKAGAQAGIHENVRFIQRTRQEMVAGGRVKATFGLHASLTLSEQTLEACREAVPHGVGFHVHVAESTADQYDSLAKSGTRVVDRLERHELLGEKSIVVHAVHVDAKEIGILARTGSWVTHQPRSNMNNAVGIGEVEAMMRSGIKVCLGNDGFSNAMWEEWKTAYLVHKAWQHDPRRMNGADVVRMAIYNNSALVNTFFDAPAGILAAGAVADLILVDYHPYTPMSPGNLPWHILFGFHESQVTTTVVAGKVLMRDRQLLTLDEEAIARHGREVAKKVWKKYEGIVGRYRGGMKDEG